jgi:cyclopropane fatty-acyl-phospholipid synthase-like methyltransferase
MHIYKIDSESFLRLFAPSKKMDEETFELAKENDLTLEEAQELQEVMEETGLGADDALELWREL